MPKALNRVDPDKPKGKMSAYAYFLQICREDHKKKHPNEQVNFAEFSKKCAEKWKGMGEKEKKRFHDLAATDKIRFDKDMEGYTPPEGLKPLKRKRGKKDPNAPKRALSAFFWFCNDERAQVKKVSPNLAVSDVAKELGKRWAVITKDSKDHYEQLAAKDKLRYEREMVEFKGGDFKRAPTATSAKKAVPAAGPAAATVARQAASDDEDDEEGDTDEE